MGKTLVIGVMGSAKNAPSSQFEKAERLGRKIAELGHTLLTGATIGLTRKAAIAALQAGGITIGISPFSNRKEHKEGGLPLDDTHIIFTGLGFTGRNLINIRSCDAVIFIGGSNGTLNEFTVAYAEGKIIGILENSTGFSSHYRGVLKIVGGKHTGARIIADKSPEKLVERVVELALDA